MRIELNGQEHDLRMDATVAEAVDAVGADRERRGVAVAVEGEVVPRSAWEATTLCEGQKVEVLEARQGG